MKTRQLSSRVLATNAATTAVLWAPLVHAFATAIGAIRNTVSAASVSIAVVAQSACYAAARFGFAARTRRRSAWTLGLWLTAVAALLGISPAIHSHPPRTWTAVLSTPLAGAYAAAFAWVVWPRLRPGDARDAAVIQVIGGTWVAAGAFVFLVVAPLLSSSNFGDMPWERWGEICCDIVVPPAVAALARIIHVREGKPRC
jgi:hypothetical protein